MKTCKHPKCTKTLVGKEKIFCKSCGDKMKGRAKIAGTIASGLALSVVAVVTNSKGGGKA